jgi:hypothetical protein
MLLYALLALSSAHSDEFLCPCMERAIMTDEYLACYKMDNERKAGHDYGLTTAELLSQMNELFRQMRARRKDPRVSDGVLKSLPKARGDSQSEKAERQDFSPPPPQSPMMRPLGGKRDKGPVIKNGL